MCCECYVFNLTVDMWMAHYNVWTLQKCSPRPLAACQPANPSCSHVCDGDKKANLKKQKHNKHEFKNRFPSPSYSIITLLEYEK